MMIARRHAAEATVYRVRFGSPQWLELAPVIARVRLPARREGAHARRVPPHLLHLFRNAAAAQLDVASLAPFIARRLITSFVPDGLAWGTVNLPASAWEHAAATRGLEPARRALADNLARDATRAADHVRGILPPDTAASTSMSWPADCPQQAHSPSPVNFATTST
jgi:hypothetical protein